jgi:hypothetical protein
MEMYAVLILKGSRFSRVCEDVEVFLIDFPHISILMDIVVIDIPDAWGMLLSRSWSVALGGFLSMDLTHAHIPMGDGTFQILYNQEKDDRHVMDLDGLDYVSECDYDVPTQSIEYDPSELPFMQEDSIDVLLPWTDEYKEKLSKYHGKEPGSIQILKKEDKKHEEKVEETVMRSLHVLIIHLALILLKEVLCSCGTRERESLGMTSEITNHGLALTSPRRSLIKRGIIWQH